MGYKKETFSVPGPRKNGSWYTARQKELCAQNINYVLGLDIKSENSKKSGFEIGAHLTPQAKDVLRQVLNHQTEQPEKAKVPKTSVKQLKNGKWKAVVFTDTLGNNYESNVQCIRARDQIYFLTSPAEIPL
eukprot:TRINITY_DN4997_c0_g1_i1.p1 TRINITY_DN4997_c0_g1~~TRINITY_DN4997_c0_g1_i1.p1  ORF type:complete len:142 (-),score=27.36 TRINITY_DN4997_c0_g1_i1:110-502(-)